jgi:GTPase SAR1 family protein
MVCIDNLTFRTMDIGNPVWQDMWSRHIKRANAIIFVVDCSSPDLYSILEEFKTVTGDSRLKKLPILLIGTKIDIPNALSMEDLERHFVCRSRPFKIYVTNLLTRQGYTDGFIWLSDVIFKKNTDQ